MSLRDCDSLKKKDSDSPGDCQSVGHRFLNPRTTTGDWAKYIELGYLPTPWIGLVKHRYVPPLIQDGKWIRSGYWVSDQPDSPAPLSDMSFDDSPGDCQSAESSVTEQLSDRMTATHFLDENQKSFLTLDEDEGAPYYYDEILIRGDLELSLCRFYLSQFREHHTEIWLIEQLKSHGIEDPRKIIEQLIANGELELRGPDEILHITRLFQYPKSSSLRHSPRSRAPRPIPELSPHGQLNLYGGAPWLKVWNTFQSYLEDLKLRSRALPLRDLSSNVTMDPKGHPVYELVCDNCGNELSVLSHCGHPLCLPCWKKASRRSLKELDPVIFEIAKMRLSTNMRHGLRFVTLTIKHDRSTPLKAGITKLEGSLSELYKTEFWSSRVDGSITKMEVTLTINGWHTHAHVITVGRFMPAGEDYADEGESNLSDEWLKITGDSIIVEIESMGETLEELAKGIVQYVAKYVAKPFATDEEDSALDNWAPDRKRELAELLAGNFRVRWYCKIHHSRNRKKCLEYRPEISGVHSRACEGEYRLERTGYRRLRWRGSFRVLHHAITHEEIESDYGASKCFKCDTGRMRGENYYRALCNREHAYGAGLPWARLNLTITHKYSSDSPAEIYSQLSLGRFYDSVKAPPYF